ncbi:MAG: family 20 glycosylhydrolase [Phycisphaerales bacterium]|nr:family 20 glycosylhydrolase [Phycisphaerales bacterium]
MLKNNGIPIKGVHLSFTAQMMRFEHMLTLIDDLARWGFNTLMLDYCNRFPFAGRFEKARAPDAFTKEQVQTLIAKANAVGIQLIPLLQCLGHLPWLLRLDEFAQYGEGYGNANQPPPIFGIPLCEAGLCPSRPEALSLFLEMADQVLALHKNARYFHIGGDEVELDPNCPHCQSRHTTEGPHGILAAHYKQAARDIRSRGPDPIIWGDMILAYPETLDALRGHVTVMDWDYWSTLQPSPHLSLLWGIRGNADPHNPETWREIQKKILRPYVYSHDPHLFKPFPFTQLLRDYGFPVIAAPAARSHGDSSIVPKALHVDNTIAAVRTAAQCHILGVMITSWDVRRSPWPLAELTLMTGGHLLNCPQATQQQIDLRFAQEYFGMDDTTYAQIPRWLGQTSAQAIRTADLLSSRVYFDRNTGQRLAKPLQDQDFKWARANPTIFLNAYESLKDAAAKTRVLLEKATPSTQRQKDRVTLWLWACDLLTYFTDLAPQILIETGKHNKPTLENLRSRGEHLRQTTTQILAPLYTNWTMQSEDQTRFHVPLAYIDEMLRACYYSEHYSSNT